MIEQQMIGGSSNHNQQKQEKVALHILQTQQQNSGSKSEKNMAMNKKSQIMIEDSQLNTSRNCPDSAEPECLSNKKAGGEMDNEKIRVTNVSQQQSVEEDECDEEMSEEMTDKVTNN